MSGIYFVIVVIMIITDVLYDLTIGVTGAIIGAFIVGMLSRKKTRRLSNQIVLGQKDLESLRLENNRLIETIKNREDKILKLQQRILKKKTQK